MCQPGGGCLAKAGNGSCCWDVAFILCQLSSLLLKSQLPALPGGCSLIQTWSPTSPAAVEGITGAFCWSFWFFLVLPQQFLTVSMPCSVMHLVTCYVILKWHQGQKSALWHFACFPEPASSQHLFAYTTAGWPCLCFSILPDTSSCNLSTLSQSGKLNPHIKGFPLGPVLKKCTGRVVLGGEQIIVSYNELEVNLGFSTIMARRSTWHRKPEENSSLQL